MVVIGPKVAVGDEIAIAGPGHSAPDRRGEVLDVRGPPGREVYWIRWSNGNVTMFAAAAAVHGVRTGAGARVVEDAEVGTRSTRRACR